MAQFVGVPSHTPKACGLSHLSLSSSLSRVNLKNPLVRIKTFFFLNEAKPEATENLMRVFCSADR